MDVLFNISNVDDFAMVSNDILSNLLDDDTKETTIIGENDFNPAKKEVNNILIETNCNTHEIKKLLSDNGFNEELINIFCFNVEKRRCSLLLLILLQHNSSFGDTVVTFDWLVKLVCGTSELKKLKYPLVQLVMTTIHNKQLQSHRSYDITKDMLTKLISVLENIE